MNSVNVNIENIKSSIQQGDLYIDNNNNIWILACVHRNYCLISLKDGAFWSSSKDINKAIVGTQLQTFTKLQTGSKVFIILQ